VLTACGRTDVGRERTGNEDAFLADLARGLFVVADGMGGHNAGEVASRITVDTLAEFVRASREDAGITWPYGFVTSLGFEANQLRSALQLANQEIRFKAQREPAYAGMGSTVVALLVQDDRVAFASVGDSRLYRWRNRQLTQLSKDDSWAASMLNAGASPEAIRQHGMAHMLTRALGTAQALDVTVSEFSLADDDVLLICSDGLYGPLGNEGIAKVLAEGPGDVDMLTSALLAAANGAGGPDNITAVVVRYGGGRRRRTLAGEAGQALSEYVVTAGLLVAIGIVVSGLLIDMMQRFVTNIVHELSFLTP